MPHARADSKGWSLRRAPLLGAACRGFYKLRWVLQHNASANSCAPVAAGMRLRLQVTFGLHHTFANPNRICTQPPYEVTEQGWGEFDINVTVGAGAGGQGRHVTTKCRRHPVFRPCGTSVLQGGIGASRAWVKGWRVGRGSGQAVRHGRWSWNLGRGGRAGGGLLHPGTGSASPSCVLVEMKCWPNR